MDIDQIRTLPVVTASGGFLEAGAVKLIDSMNDQIATAAEEQSAVAEEINRNIVAIKELAEQTTAGAQQTTQFTDELAQLAQQLQSAVAHFRS